MTIVAPIQSHGSGGRVSEIDAIEVVDGQIHELRTFTPELIPDSELRLQVSVELTVEAMNSVGVDAALAVASEAFIACAVARHPGRFAGVITLEGPLERASEIERIKFLPGVAAGRLLIADWRDATLRPQFVNGDLDPVFAAAEQVGLPLFCSTHGQTSAMVTVAERHPGLPLIIDHIGLRQTPVSPPTEAPWERFPDLLALARYPNVSVKLSGAPLFSQTGYPFEDVLPRLDQLLEAFGPARLMWASDYTRVRGADLPYGPRPRRRGLTYAESLAFIRESDRFPISIKRELLGASLRRILGWDRD